LRPWRQGRAFISQSETTVHSRYTRSSSSSFTSSKNNFATTEFQAHTGVLTTRPLSTRVRGGLMRSVFARRSGDAETMMFGWLVLFSICFLNAIIYRCSKKQRRRRRWKETRYGNGRPLLSSYQKEGVGVGRDGWVTLQAINLARMQYVAIIVPPRLHACLLFKCRLPIEIRSPFFSPISTAAACDQ